jgi:hypothetical protein
MTTKRLLLSIALCAVIAACSKSSPSTLNGTYEPRDERNSTYVFSPDGTVKAIGKEGVRAEAHYTVKDNVVSWQFPEGLPQSYTIGPDGALSAPGSKGYTRKQP